MCGIAGMVDLAGGRPVPVDILHAMADALVHRGPDDEGFLVRPGIGLASRRLSIIGLLDGHQPIANEDQKVVVVCNGEVFDYPTIQAELEQRGHRFKTHCDAEVIPHLWEEYQEAMFDHLRGQFALALWDQHRQRLILGRDRFGICPLYWTQQRDWLLFASEIKALLASGMLEARPDCRGLNHLFTFFALPGPVTCFAGVSVLLPGHYLQIQLDRLEKRSSIHDHTYWQIDFPDQGQEDRPSDCRRLVDQFETLMLCAVERRLRADVPVVAYLSGGVDSSLVTALASRILRRPIPTFTIAIQDPALNETEEAALVARYLGADSVVVDCGLPEIHRNYPQLIQAAEGPVIDTACAALLLLAKKLHALHYKVTLTGEGSDEWLAGYPWFKANQLLGLLDVIPGLPLSLLARRCYLRLTRAPRSAWSLVRQAQRAAGGHNAWLEIYGLMSLSKVRFFSEDLQERLSDHCPYDDLELNLERLRRWHPLNRALYLGGRVMLPGLLLNAKGDRVAMHSSVETRYPFLDEEVFAFLANLHPRWKMRGLQDKFLLRLLAQRWLPRHIAWRPKGMFRAPLDSFYSASPPKYVSQLLSEESLGKTGYFNPQSVRYWRQGFRGLRAGSYQRTSVELGLMGVVATQLWHHLFIDSSLADLPGRVHIARPALAS